MLDGRQDPGGQLGLADQFVDLFGRVAGCVSVRRLAHVVAPIVGRLGMLGRVPGRFSFWPATIVGVIGAIRPIGASRSLVSPIRLRAPSVGIMKWEPDVPRWRQVYEQLRERILD